MRILAIRGENLASLAARFHLDLSDGPLGSTGIFAITGETGAGKSTILDALCLALYGQYPRVSAGRREDVPDPSGQTLGSGDGRAILRRGAGSGFAEVDFLAQDGTAYRVHWGAFRARGRANGRLQGETRTLLRISDEATIATSKTAVAEAVERLTDLTFDQFRRTVVLAQGEFDAFLLATAPERADLLEKITGTEIYSEISKRVHAGTTERRTALAALTVRREAMGGLDAEARAALVTEHDTIQAELPLLAAEGAALASDLDHARRVATAEARLAEAEARVAETARALVDANPEAERLAALDAAEPLRRLVAEAAQAALEHDGAAELLERANEEAVAAEAGVATAEATEAAARAEDNAREAELGAFLPAWTEADGLDAAIRDRTHDSATAARRTAAAHAALIAAGDDRAALAHSHEACLAAHSDVARRVEAGIAHWVLADRADEIAGLFAKREALTAEAARTVRDRDIARTRMAEADAATAEAQARLARARQARAAQVASRAEHAAARAGIDVAAAEARLARLQELLDALVPIRGLFAASACATADLDRAVAARTDAEARRRDAGTRRAAAEAARGQAERARAEIVSLADLAEGSASPQAARLRSFLVAEQPCPVCGGREHPYANAIGASPDRLEHIAGAMRERRESIDAEITGLAGAVAAARGDEEAAQARLEASEREADAARDRITEATTAYAALRPGLSAASEAAGATAIGHDDLPDALAPGRHEWLEALAASAASIRKGLAEDLSRGRELTLLMEACGQAIVAADEEAARADDAIAAEGGPRDAAMLATERASTQALNLAERLSSLGRELTPYLETASLTVADLDGNAARSAARLAALGADHRELRERLRRLDAERRDGDERRQRALEAEAVARATWEAEARTARERAAALFESQALRDGLLGGEATATHRGRITGARETARAALRTAVEASGAARTASASCRAAFEYARVQLARAKAAHEDCVLRLGGACGVRRPEAVAALLAVAPEVREALRTRLRDLGQAWDAASVTAATRRADLDALRSVPMVDVGAAETAAAGIVARMDAHRHRGGVLAAELARDDAVRRDADALEAEIASAAEAMRAWEDVDAAVGSATGDRFRRFVQGVTLEHLVLLANVQLRSLSPRYALVRGKDDGLVRGKDDALALHVIDRDMGDELRGMRSLSGGERFLVALALALALSGLEGRQSLVDTLFIDEGFGSLDAETLDMAVDALETLQGHGRKVGVITHVAAMIDRIAVQVRVERRGNGRSTIRIVDGTLPMPS